jgi:hypothetical protein
MDYGTQVEPPMLVIGTIGAKLVIGRADWSLTLGFGKSIS